MYPAYYVDAAGQKLDGGRRYALRFAPGKPKHWTGCEPPRR
ncbi:MAG: hypothetical protein WAV18_23900 [Roseiarcus sp.]